MVLKKFFLISLFLSSSLLHPAANADNLNMRSIGVAPSDIATPVHGSNMNAVIQRYGEPQNRMPAVGEPPITRWVYSDFTVFFEHQHVIHSVVHR